MYPYPIIFDLDLYYIFIMVGVILCFGVVRLLGDKRGMNAKWQNMVLALAFCGVVLGYGSAVLFQGFYNIVREGHFVINNDTGATFYGGLIGGVTVMIGGYFAVGHFLFPDGYHKTHFFDLCDIAAASVAIAHGFGRIGCLMAGCCYGKPTNAWYGIKMVNLGYKVIPTQLFEALFLFMLFAFLYLRTSQGKKGQFPLYMIFYGAWRFVIEYLRDDYRGSSLVPFLTPSQLIAVLMFVSGIALFFWQRHMVRKQTEVRQ